MVQALLSSGGPAPRVRRYLRHSSVPLQGALAAAISGLVIVGSLSFSSIAPPVESLNGDQVQTPTTPPTQETVAIAALGSDDATPVSAPSVEPEPPQPSQSAVPAPEVLPSASPVADIEPHTPFAEQVTARPLDPPPAPETALQVRTVPLPVPRPPELRQPNASEPSRRADRKGSRRTKTTALPATTEDDRSFFEKLFGIERSPNPPLAYAALGSDAIDTEPRRLLDPTPAPEAGAGTAIYDISARIVTLPSGEKLEAHSGLGASMDNPRYVDLRMRGSTPPGTYDLTEREQPFHGVRALRLNPVGGSAAVYGRTGLLAHTYLLGPSGASNGCVSFRDYDKFLQAYLRGEVRRLVVVPGQGQDARPVIANKSTGMPGRSARRSSDVRVASLP